MRLALWLCCISIIAGCVDRLPTLHADGANRVVDLGVTQDLIAPDTHQLETGVIVTVDKRSYSTSEEVMGTVHNGTKESIFLGGCSIFARELFENAVWTEMPAVMVCGWEGVGIELKPGESYQEMSYFNQPGSWRLRLPYATDCLKPGESYQEMSYFNQPGSWRLRLPYATDCMEGEPLSQAGCTGAGKVFSTAATALIDKASCEIVNRKYRSAMDKAATCQPDATSPQCGATMVSDLICGCSTWINDATGPAYYADRWEAWGCYAVLPSPCDMACDLPPQFACVDGVCRP
ncbi:MAG: hypothetical protein JRH20_28915 [Deltaproteobacteria bacterium]|nr:hypothetical protein [Deltaproteobacteria bacterium]